MLLALISGEEVSDVHKTLSTSLVPRASTAPPPPTS
jgi:hypothetical protein